ncbi:MAG: hypothetical protein K2X39_03995 [Silvanigrellaceae bacterium]|nr:hypothetical protein [Silvanigrellaceae bacterium]
MKGILKYIKAFIFIIIFSFLPFENYEVKFLFKKYIFNDFQSTKNNDLENQNKLKFTSISSIHDYSQNEIIIKVFHYIKEYYYFLNQFLDKKNLEFGFKKLTSFYEDKFFYYPSIESFIARHKTFTDQLENMNLTLNEKPFLVTQPFLAFKGALFEIKKNFYYCKQYSSQYDLAFECIPELLHKISIQLDQPKSQVLSHFLNSIFSHIDPYSTFLNQKQYTDLNENIEGRNEILEIKNNRTKQLGSVTSKLFKKVMYFKITQFTNTTSEEFLSLFVKNKLKYKNNFYTIVLDLRDNPGGIFNEAIKISNFFLENTQIITAKSSASETVYKAFPSLKIYNPLVILVNGKSASASEIVASSLKENKRALIVGKPTYGKASVQSVFPLPQDHGIKLTTSFYFSPHMSNTILQKSKSNFELWYKNKTFIIKPDLEIADNLERFILNCIEKVIQEKKQIKHLKSVDELKYTLKKCII